MRIALLEARMSGELGEMFRRRGHEVVSAPAVREVALAGDAETVALLASLRDGTVTVVVFLTGVAATLLLQSAERQGQLPALLDALRGAVTVCRGPKPTAVLRRHAVPVQILAPEPHTTDELLTSLAAVELTGTGVAVLHYGERNDALTDALRERGALVHDLCLYEWRLPDDQRPLANVIMAIIAGQVDAVVFTSQIQARHLFEVAERFGQTEDLQRAMRGHTVVAAIGPTCAAALDRLGVPPHVEPEHPKMGFLVAALDGYLLQRAGL